MEKKKTRRTAAACIQSGVQENRTAEGMSISLTDTPDKTSQAGLSVCPSESESKEIQSKAVTEDIAADEILSGADGEDVKTDSAESTAAVNKSRRSSGSGSVYPLTGGKGFGFCIQLSADKELRKLYGNKLRHLGSGKTYEEAEAKCLQAIGNRESLLQAKLAKLGHTFKE